MLELYFRDTNQTYAGKIHRSMFEYILYTNKYFLHTQKNFELITR